MPTDIFPYLGALVIGLGKSGFASGLSLLQTPLIAYAVPARAALGIVLPLLILADILTLGVYWRKWRLALVRWPILGCIPGIAAGMLFVNVVSEELLRRSLGALALALTILLIVRDRWYPARVFAPRWWHGALVGAVAGFSSTLAHAAGPIMALYLMAQKVDKRTFVATSAVFFFCTNLMKLPPYVATGLVDVNILKTAAWLAPMLPVGIGIGWLFNRWISQKHFTYVVYALLLVAGVDLLFR